MTPLVSASKAWTTIQTLNCMRPKAPRPVSSNGAEASTLLSTYSTTNAV